MKKLFALLLCAALLITLPLTALAAEEDLTEVDLAPESAAMDGELTNEDLFSGYVDSLYLPNPDAYSIGGETAGSKLTGLEADVYNALVPFIKDIAAGRRQYTVITLGKGSSDYPSDVNIPLYGTFADFDRREVVLALRSDFPYEMYWFDYYTGFSINYSYKTATGELTRLSFKFTVASVFRGSDKYLTDLAKTQAAVASAANAWAIVDKHSGKEPYAQFKAYLEEICTLVSYDDDALTSNSAIDNGPWQLIRVFDGNPSTNVVCAGYAKAYQYLCDMAGLTCYYVTGRTSGAHAWNIVTLDGQNYLVDPTNCDTGMWGQDGSLFLAGGSGSGRTGYTISHLNRPGRTLTYLYDEEMLPLWGEKVLTLASRHYSPCDHVYSGSNDATCNRCGHKRQLIETTAMYRLYNPNSGEHFYTGSVQEREQLVLAGWQYEGVAWNAPTKTGKSVYRLFNPNSGDHHYTMSAQERDMLVSVGWKYEGVCWNSASSDQVPLYRLYNPNADCGSHHYTGSKEERNHLVSLGWIYEGIGWYGMP